MPITIDLYSSRDSWLHRVDPQEKLLFLACSLQLLLLFKNVLILLAALLLLHILHLSARTPLDRFGHIWKTLLPVRMLMLSLWAIFYPTGEPIFQLWVIKIAPYAMVQGSVLSLGVLSMAFVVFSWFFTTDQVSLVRSLVKLRLHYEWGLVLALDLRYIPTFQGMFGIILEAQQARGPDISPGTGFQRARAMMPIFVAMVISSLGASDQLAKAMEARAFGVKGVQRTNLHDIHFQPIDYMITIVLLVIFIGLIYFNLCHSFGVHPVNLFA